MKKLKTILFAREKTTFFSQTKNYFCHKRKKCFGSTFLSPFFFLTVIIERNTASLNNTFPLGFTHRKRNSCEKTFFTWSNTWKKCLLSWNIVFHSVHHMKKNIFFSWISLKFNSIHEKKHFHVHFVITERKKDFILFSWLTE